MRQLNNEQKELIFDYCMSLTSAEQSVEAKRLISSNKQAADINQIFKSALSPLENLEPDICPDELVENTVYRLNNLARSSQAHLQQLLADEQAQNAVRVRFWPEWAARLARAAVFMIVGSVLITSWNILKVTSNCILENNDCQRHMAQVYRGLESYSADHEGKLPAVATSAGAPWWKIGDQGKENQSNTRHLWLLPKGGYVLPADFVCPARKEKLCQFNPSQIAKLHDFPSRHHITYSFRLLAGNPGKGILRGRKILMSDLSPLFEALPSYGCGPLNIPLDKFLKTANSINHGRRGQNVLFSDGSVKFKKARRVGMLEDDIYTLQNTSEYRGTEVPACESDTFLAP